MAEPIWTPSAETVRGSRLTAFMEFCAHDTGQAFADSDALYRWSVEDSERFWRLLLGFSELICEGDADPVCTGGGVEHATFFPGLRLSYAENLLACAEPRDLERRALTARCAGGVTETLTRGELAGQVHGFAAVLRAIDVTPGDRVVSVLRNDAGSVVAALGCAAAGVTFSSSAPDMGVPSLVSRFSQLDPAALVVSSIDAPGFERGRLLDLLAGLPTVRSVVVLDDGPSPTGFPLPVHRSRELESEHQPSAEWVRYPFNHPLFILFSSGTAGAPKCIVHGAGGTLLEHTKEHLLHGDLRAGDRLFFHTSTAWMMWNWQLSALAVGAEIVLYDGPVVDPRTLWRIVADERVTAFGTSPPYLRMGQSTGYAPNRELDLSALRSVMSTGSILHDDQFRWVRQTVGALPLQSISGGTDIVGCFVLGNPNLPVYTGEAQCRSFGMDVRAVAADGSPAGSAIGELVCAAPFPSRPLGLYGDASGERFHAAYFAQHPGVWTHGDLIEITATGGARMHGRSDATMNVRGIRIGPAEIYRVLDSFAEIRESLAVEQSIPSGAGDSRMVLLVVMGDGHRLDSPLRARIRTAIARQASPAHIPAVIVEVPELPLTHNGKRSELAARQRLNGEPVHNLEALRNPDSLQAIAAAVAAHDARAATRAAVDAPAGTLEHELTAIWERVLGVSPLGPDDDFFENGGTSLLTAPLFQQIADRLGRRLPLSAILHAPTISSLAALLRDDPDDQVWGPVILLKPGTTRRPLFMLPGDHGEVLGLRPLAQHIGTDRAVYGLRSRGLMEGELPFDRVEDMAADLAASLRSVQPRGPYSVLGYSLGGPVALEVARRLLQAGEQVEFVCIIDTVSPWACFTRRERLAQALRVPLKWPRALTRDLRRTVGVPNRGRVLREHEARLGIRLSTVAAQDPPTVRLEAAGRRALKSYRPEPYAGPVVFVRAAIQRPLQPDAAVLWSRIAGRLTVRQAPGHHDELINNSVADVGRAITETLPGGG